MNTVGGLEVMMRPAQVCALDADGWPFADRVSIVNLSNPEHFSESIRRNA